MGLAECPACAAVYERSVRMTSACTAGQFQCNCGHILAQWHGWQAVEFKPVGKSADRSRPTSGTGSRKPDPLVVIMDIMRGD